MLTFQCVMLRLTAPPTEDYFQLRIPELSMHSINSVNAPTDTVRVAYEGQTTLSDYPVYMWGGAHEEVRSLSLDVLDEGGALLGNVARVLVWFNARKL